MKKSKSKGSTKKLTPEEVYLMRQLKVVGNWHQKEADKLTTKNIAKLFDIGVTTANDAITGRTWGDVPFPKQPEGD